MGREHEAKEGGRVAAMLAGVYSRDLTACGIPRGLDALTSCRMGVMSWLDATPKPPKVKGGTPSRATRDHPLKDACFDLFLRLVRSSQSELKGN
ncbi:TPA: hypothetical protein H2W59_004543 [Salmonella enterica]|nr:hypothetical protein [Salmonella enterica]